MLRVTAFAFGGYDESREVSFQVSSVFLAQLSQDLALDAERQLALFDRHLLDKCLCVTLGYTGLVNVVRTTQVSFHPLS